MGLRDMYSAGDIIEYEGGRARLPRVNRGQGGAVGERLQSVVD